MIDLILFELAGGVYALSVAAVARVLAPRDPIPPDCALADLKDLLGLLEAPAIDDRRQGHRALLAGRGVAVRMGRPLGAVRVDPAWILPLPGYIFVVEPAPFRGMLDIPQRATARSALRAAHGGLLLREDSLADLARPGARGQGA